VKTREATGFSVGVGRAGLWANFHPALLVEPDGFWASVGTGGINISQLYFDFQSGKASLNFQTGRMGRFLDLFMDVRDGIEAKFGAAIKSVLPAWAAGGNYDPYNDPELTQHLSGVVNAMTAAFPASGGGGTNIARQITEPEINLHATPIPTAIPLSSSMKLTFTKEASIGINARLQGNMKDALAKPKAKDITVSTEGVQVEHETWGTLGGLRVHRLVLGPDLSVKDFQYTLGLEDGLGVLKLGALLLQMRTGEDLGVRDMNRPELKAVRERVDKDVREKLPGALRDQLNKLAGSMPGSPLMSIVDGTTGQ
jgi:hypothetical protein